MKNPLYVVKGKDVLEANSVFDLVIKKLNLEPAVNLLRNLFYFLLEQVENFGMYQAVKAYIDEIIRKMNDLGKRFGLIEA
jgi:hypothetical protein